MIQIGIPEKEHEELKQENRKEIKKLRTISIHASAKTILLLRPAMVKLVDDMDSEAYLHVLAAIDNCLRQILDSGRGIEKGLLTRHLTEHRIKLILSSRSPSGVLKTLDDIIESIDRIKIFLPI